MKELIQRLMVYVIIVSALRGLLMNKKYEEYFRFFSGTLMILMLLSPVLLMFGNSTDWYHTLEENFLQLDIQEIEGTLKVADRGFEKIVKKEYEDTIGKEIEMLAEEEGITLKETQVRFAEGEDGWEIAEISGKNENAEMKKKHGNDTETDSLKEDIAIETIRIREEEPRERPEDTSDRAQGLKEKISKKFSVSKEKVHIWK